jgi:hypothetical protein
MKAYVLSVVLIFSFLLVLSAAGIAQQSNSVASISVPFAFWVNDTRFPAGEYILDHSQPAAIIVRSKDGRLIESAPTLINGDPIPANDARAIFVLRKGRYELVKIWGIFGKRTLSAHLDEDNGDGVREVKITHANAGVQEPKTQP